MRRIGLIGACLIASGALGAFATSAAQAAAPEFFTKAPVGVASGPISFTGTLGTGTLEPYPSKDKVVCKKGAATGEVTGPKTARNGAITFTECEGASTKCKSVGAPNGTIVVGGLEGTLGALSPTKPGIRLQEEGGGQIAEINCGGVLEVTVEGAVYGELTGGTTASIAAAKLPTSLSLVFTEKSGVQKWLKFEGEAGEEQLHGLVNGKEEKQGDTATAKLTSIPAGDVGVTD